MTTIHHAAAEGFAKQADAYAKGRPDYPAPALVWLQNRIGLAPGKTALDLGAGTGKFTALLAETGAQIIAVEPVEAMRAKLTALLPEVTALGGTAEAMPVASNSVDVLVCAQAFHWFATPAAVAEIHRVLKPGGELVLIWNVRDESADWVKTLTDIVTPYEGDAPRFYKGDWRHAFPAPGMSELVEVRFPHLHVGPAERVIVDRFLSVSFIAALPDMEREQVAAQLRQLIATHPALVGRAEVAFPYQTLAYHCHKLA